MRHLTHSKYDVRDVLAESLYGQEGATCLPMVALGIWATTFLPDSPLVKDMVRVGIAGSAFVPVDITGGDDWRQLWYGQAILLPETKFRQPKPRIASLRADQFLCMDFTNPQLWGQQIFGDKRNWKDIVEAAKAAHD